MRSLNPLGRFRSRAEDAAIRRRLDQLQYRRPRLLKPRFGSRSQTMQEQDRDDRKAA